MNTEQIRTGQWKRGYYGRVKHYFVDGKAVCGSPATARVRLNHSDYGKTYPKCKKCVEVSSGGDDEPAHNIFFDRAGWGNYPRVTCLTCNVTCLKEPHMSAEQWVARLVEFKRDHPSEWIDRYIEKLSRMLIY